MTCDKNNSRRPKSPSWQGARWYRFMGAAGTRLPERPPNWSSQSEGVCGTHCPGYLNGHHPKNPGELVTRNVCFIGCGSNNCWKPRSVKIRHCQSYFVYYLVDVYACSLRYCAE